MKNANHLPTEEELHRIEQELSELWCERDTKIVADRATVHLSNLIASVRRAHRAAPPRVIAA